MKILIAFLALCVQFLIVDSNTCQWLNEGLDCVIKCIEGGSSYYISSYVQSVYDEITDCHANGVKLVLPKDVTGYTVSSNWLDVDINLIDLEIDAQYIMEFESNVLASPVFNKVKKLHFKNFRLLESYDFDIRKTVLSGFHSLEDLLITNSAVKIWDNGWLDRINGTIKSLLLSGMGEESSLLVDKLTGGSALILSNVEYVKIQYNLTNTINERSFTAIPNVKELDLSDCNISVIDELSFKNLGPKLQILNLERNRLKTLPADIFSSLSLSSGAVTLQSDEDVVVTNLIIRLNHNLWHCDCFMDHLKDLLIANTNFDDDDILCTTPEEIINYPIRETEFCPLPITTTKSPTTETTTTEATDPIDNEKECSSYHEVQSKIKVSIQPPMQPILLNSTSEGVSVILDKHSSDLLLIWFKSEKFTSDTLVYYQNANASDCFVNLSNLIFINDLETETSYTFCLMNISQQTVSPLDCISYYNHGEEETLKAVWLYASNKPLTISVIVIVCIGNICIGVIIGAIVLKFSKYRAFSFQLAFQCWKDPLHEATNPRVIGDVRNRLNSDSNQFNNYSSPPPLPPHPLRDSIDDDVYYATVKYNS